MVRWPGGPIQGTLGAMPTWVLIGAGYTGARLGRRLVVGVDGGVGGVGGVGIGVDGGVGVEGVDEVIVTRREGSAATAAATALGSDRVRGVAVDLSRRETLAGLVPTGAIVVCLAPPGDDPAGEIEAAVAAAAAAGASRFVYVSSTGVYAPAGGAWVDESWPVAPATRSGRARAAAEAALAASELARAGRTITLRVAGIHGPGRGLVERIRAGTYRIVGDGRAHVSRIHVDDLVEAIVRAGTSQLTGAVNIADDDPAPIGEVADALAAKLGLPPPPRVSIQAVGAEIVGMLTADRRIANRRMKEELRVVLRYPSWRSVA